MDAGALAPCQFPVRRSCLFSICLIFIYLKHFSSKPLLLWQTASPCHNLVGGCKFYTHELQVAQPYKIRLAVGVWTSRRLTSPDSLWPLFSSAPLRLP